VIGEHIGLQGASKFERARNDVAPLVDDRAHIGRKAVGIRLVGRDARHCAYLSFGPPSSPGQDSGHLLGPRETLQDAGDELRMPRSTPRRRHPAVGQLGGYAPQRQALLLQIAENGRQLNGAGHCLGSRLTRHARGRRNRPAATFLQ
jgi:hypothetical protein